jgi:hypothetical protein
MGEKITKATCKTCRWWNTKGEYVWDTKPDATYECERITSGYAGRRSARLYPVSSGAWLSTRPDFSCAMHEPAGRAALSEGDNLNSGKEGA